jgi:hypothetical protein
LLNGQISATMIQAQGPQEYPKPTMKSQTMTTAAQPAALCVGHWSRFLATMTATMMWLRKNQLVVPSSMKRWSLPCRHHDGTGGENWLAAYTIDVEHGWNGCDKHYDSNNASGKERDSVSSETKRLEDCRGVVKDCVYARPLLEEPGITVNIDSFLK